MEKIAPSFPLGWPITAQDMIHLGHIIKFYKRLSRVFGVESMQTNVLNFNSHVIVQAGHFQCIFAIECYLYLAGI